MKHRAYNVRTSGSFGLFTLERRFPAIIGQVLQRVHPSEPWLVQAHADPGSIRISRDRVRPDDASHWSRFFDENEGRHLIDLDFFECEVYLYATLLKACGYYEHGVDPFANIKDDDLSASIFRLERASASDLKASAYSIEERLDRCLEYALLGNTVDLSNPQHSAAKHEAPNIIQGADRGIVRERLCKSRRLVYIVDNAFSELWYDLMFIRTLLDWSPDLVIDIVVKAHPIFVSDATGGDLDRLFALFHEGVEYPSMVQVVRETVRAIERKRLNVLSWPELNAPLHFSAAPFTQLFRPYDLAILKGDANYRRAFDDLEYPPYEDIDQVVSPLLPDTLFLRVLKSECLVGMRPMPVAGINLEGKDWRISGTNALLQLTNTQNRS